MIVYPNCKINIGLRVVRKREDGYHDLETIFYPVFGVCDELEITPAETFAFIQEGIAVDCKPEDNLIIRCYQRMRSLYPKIGDVRIRFKKNIPFGAGLGGGSSDAAHTAIVLNRLFDLSLTREQLIDIVRPLGADCPFFIYNTPCFAEGIGDILTPIDMDLSAYRLVMVKPQDAVSTREAYSGLTAQRSYSEALLQQRGLTAQRSYSAALLQRSGLFSNDFEATVFPLHPAIAKIKEHLLTAGALYASMSGSGSTVFALFDHDSEYRAASDRALFDIQPSAMVLFDDTLGKRQS